VGGAESPVPELAMLRFFEQSLFNELLFPALESGAAKGTQLGFEDLTRGFNTSLAELNQVNSDASLTTLAAGDPDLFISIRYGGILRERAIAIPRLGVINLHSGLLPDYRGVMATFRAMAAGDREIGATLHTIIDPGIDTGGIIATCTRGVDYERSYLWNLLQLYPDGVQLLLAAVDALAAGEPRAGLPQSPGGAYFSFPTQAEVDDFHRRGLRLYDGQELIDFAQAYLSKHP
jgi:methionyl-tRNA formyltransferase